MAGASMKFVTLIPIAFWLAILFVLGAWCAFGIPGIVVAGVLLMVLQ